MSDGGGIVELRGNVGAIAFARLTRVPHSGANCITVLNAFKPISRLQPADRLECDSGLL